MLNFRGEKRSGGEVDKLCPCYSHDIDCVFCHGTGLITESNAFDQDFRVNFSDIATTTHSTGLRPTVKVVRGEELSIADQRL